MFVFGFFLDGEDGQQPVIMGVIGFNDYTAVMAEVPDAKFVPFTGINPALGQKHATYSRKATPGVGDMAPIPPTAALKPGEETTGPEKDTQEGKTENDKITNSPEGASTEVEDGHLKSQLKKQREKNLWLDHRSVIQSLLLTYRCQ